MKLGDFKDVSGLVKYIYLCLEDPAQGRLLVYHLHKGRGKGVCVHHVMSGLRQSRDVSADGGQIPALNSRPHGLLKLRPYLGRLAAGSALTTEQTGSHLISAPDVVWPHGVGFPSEPLHGYLRTGASVLARPCI